MAADLGLPESAVVWQPCSGEIRVKGTVNQEDHSKWTHLSGRIVRADRIEQTLAWKGDIIREEG
jgi:hypothetical protein